MSVTWKHVTTKDDLLRSVKVLKQYRQQTYVDDWGVEQPARFAVDLETYRPDGDRTKFPRPIWDGTDWEFRTRLLSIGLDPIHDEFAIRDKQFLFDVKELGEPLVIAALQDLLESTPCIGHSAHYDDGCLDTYDIHPHWIDTKLLGQVKLSGKKCTHYLMDYYRRCIPKSKFFELTGMTHSDYADQMKGQMQKSDWSVPVLSRRQLTYASHDVRCLWYVWDKEGDWIEEHQDRYERNFPDNKGIQFVNKWEHRILPVFVGMEQRGIRVAKQYHTEVVIPLLEEKRDEARSKFKKWKEFRRPKKDPNFHAVSYVCDPDQNINVAPLAKNVKAEILGQLKGKITSLSVRSKAHNDGDKIFVSWVGEPETVDIIRDCASVWLDNLAKEFDDSLISIGHPETLQKAISKVMGFRVPTSKAKFLRRLLNDADERQAEILTWILRYNKAKTYASKFGRNFRKHITKRGYFHAHWHQLGSEHNEIVSGRSSCSDPPLMQMPSRDKLFTYSEGGGVGAAELLRSLMLPPVGGVFINADYSQIEPCLVAWVSRDVRLCRAIREGIDLHKLTAGIVKKLGDMDEIPDDIDLQWVCEGITKEERNKMGKTLNLGIGYGMGPAALVDHVWDMTEGELVWDTKQARRNIEKYFEFYPGVRKAIDKCEAKVCRKIKSSGTIAIGQDGSELGISQALDGRHRFLYLPKALWDVDPDILEEDYNPNRQRYFYNEFKRRVNKMRLDGWNLVIQATAATILKMAEYYVDRALNKAFANHPKWNPRVYGLHLVLHDELLVSVPDDPESIALGLKIVEQEMLRAAAYFVDFDIVPMKVGIASGSNWFAASPK
jgi:DNA polymerase I-like protein with 3'-5' exonuclease and polymerase domains